MQSVRRDADGVVIQSSYGEERFDEVIFACHSDQALALLADPGEREQAILGDMPYQANDVWLHTDARCLPARRKAWASWNYQLDGNDEARPLVSYNMNILQGVDSPEPFCVSLNPKGKVDESKVLRRFVYHHPVFNQASIAAQQRRAEIVASSTPTSAAPTGTTASMRMGCAARWMSPGASEPSYERRHRGHRT